MIYNKAQIQDRFDAASDTYDAVASVQKQCANVLIDLLLDSYPTFQPDTILDLGTGTGYIPELLLPTYLSSRFTLNDLSLSMLRCAKKKLKDDERIDYQWGDIESTDFAFHSLITSNFALQWVHDFQATLSACYMNASVFAFSCLLDGTFHEWEGVCQQQKITSPLSTYPTRNEIDKWVQSAQPRDYVIQQHDFKLAFDHPKGFMNYLKQLGASHSKTNVSFADIKQLMHQDNEPLDMTYRVLFAVIRR